MASVWATEQFTYGASTLVLQGELHDDSEQVVIDAAALFQYEPLDAAQTNPLLAGYLTAYPSGGVS